MKKKMNGLNKLLAMLLALIMVFGTMTVLADGEEAPAADPPAAGEGNNLPTQETPVIVQKDEDQTYDCNIAVESGGSEVIAVEDTNGGEIEIAGDVNKMRYLSHA